MRTSCHCSTLLCSVKSKCNMQQLWAGYSQKHVLNVCRGDPILSHMLGNIECDDKFGETPIQAGMYVYTSISSMQVTRVHEHHFCSGSGCYDSSHEHICMMITWMLVSTTMSPICGYVWSTQWADLISYACDCNWKLQRKLAFLTLMSIW